MSVGAGIRWASLGFWLVLSLDALAALPPRDAALGDTDAPLCPAFTHKSQNGGNPGNLAINNDDVLRWKNEGENTRLERGHVRGVVAKIYPDRNGHEHFSIRIGTGSGDTVEIVYNHAFGEMPTLRLGMEVEACGDYITANAPSPAPNGKTYPPSPDGAIVHWIHAAPSRSKHHSGYLIVDGVLTGQELPSDSRDQGQGQGQGQGWGNQRRRRPH